MERVIFVEVLGRRGNVVERVRLERLPATIGRGYTCDVIVADPLVDAEHARLVLDETGALVLEDLGSLNGLYTDGARRRASRIAIPGVTPARIGRTQLRIVPADAAVPPAVPDTESGDRLAALLRSPRAVAAVLAGALGFAAASLWVQTYQSKAASLVAGEVLALGVLSVAWAGVWALIGRGNVQRFSFWPHLAATWLFIVVASAVEILGGYLRFLVPAQPLAAAIGPLAAIVLAAALLARHLGLATLMTRRRRNWVAAIATAALLALGLLASKLASDELSPDATVAIGASLKPLPARLIPATGLESFLRATDRLKREVDRLKAGE